MQALPKHPSPRAAALRAAALEVERRWGVRASGRLFAGRYAPPLGFPTGLPELDRATGFGGVPRGRLTELTGAPSSGKLSLALRAVISAQTGGGVAAYVDLPGAFYPPAAEAMGVDLRRLVVVRPDHAAAALKAASTLLLSEGFDAVLVDLGAAQARPEALARLAGLSARGAAATLAVTSGGLGLNPGSAGLRFFASLRLAVARQGWLWREGHLGSALAGVRLRVEILKTRTAAGLRNVTVDCPFAGRMNGAQDDLRLDTQLPDGYRDSAMPGLGLEAAGDLRAAV